MPWLPQEIAEVSLKLAGDTCLGIALTVHEWAKQYYRSAGPHNGLVDAINKARR